jgi:hypothetical protein
MRWRGVLGMRCAFQRRLPNVDFVRDFTQQEPARDHRGENRKENRKMFQGNHRLLRKASATNPNAQPRPEANMVNLLLAAIIEGRIIGGHYRTSTRHD